MQNNIRYWIGVASRDHVMKSVDGEFAQLCHGKEAPLKKMKKGDWIIYYSPKIWFKQSAPHQKFTALGRVVDDYIFQFDMEDGFIPFRRNIEFMNCTETPIHPLIPQLSFIKNKRYWGYSFRLGHLEISENDFKIIRNEMIRLKGN
ncbi:EVE domain-containing protein [Priestia megaterium]|uniref:EVE domain-containing protein n=4 Tax=Priestia megaterium TaxID=1404 RepID=UPI00048BE187|nr:EVE domain-containing protein [Priestia megaterium]PFD97785.1 EVE domain-containing protein [Priestia megaterium]PFJ96144.1 EVE domain-containing protein [Priestia megaterium]PMD10726.1 EVE domain-containing protein [Priestia megaterium]